MGGDARNPKMGGSGGRLLSSAKKNDSCKGAMNRRKLGSRQKGDAATDDERS